MDEKTITERWLRTAEDDGAVWLGDVREASGRMRTAKPVVVQLTLPDGRMRDLTFSVPPWGTQAARDWTAEYVRACLYNILSVYSGRRMTLYRDREDAALCALLEDAVRPFRQGRGGYGKVVSMAARLCRSMDAEPFSFAFEDAGRYVPAPPEKARPAALGPRLLRAAERAARGLYCGVDVGGTDIKLVLARDGRLRTVAVMDWDPASSPTAEGILDPLLAFIGQAASGEKLDGLGVSYPDVVIGDRVVGGETPKTRGMRQNAADYEAEFAKITALRDRLTSFCRPGAPVRIINDGHMAAFTAAMELACGGRGEALAGGVAANTLGTDLGTGLVEPDGTIPGWPMELYDLLLDLGSRPSRRRPPRDLRAVCNENSGLPGVRRYVGQSAAFRLAWQREPALLEGFTVREGETLLIGERPDLRKPCLAHLTQAAAAGDRDACAVFRQIGRHLGQVYREMQWLLRPATDTRQLFGRFVMEPACFAQIQAGCAQTAPWIRLEAADETMANSPLMRALADWPGATVAQYGQAAGGIYYCLL